MPGEELFPKLYRAMFGQARTALSVLDLEGRQIIANRAFHELMAVEPGATTGENVDGLTRPADQAWTRDFIGRLASGELEEFRTEKVYRRGDGTDILCELRAWPIAVDGEVVAVVGSIRPVEERPIVSDIRIRKFLENIEDTVALVDADGRLLESTGRYRPTLGYPREFWEQRTVLDVLHPDDAAVIAAMRDELVAEPGYHLAGEYRLRNVDGGYDLFEVHAVNLIHDPDIGGIVITCHNVTDRAAMVQEMEASRDEALSQAELRVRLIATVSHELRNPLHAMRGLSELLATGDLDEENHSLANALHRQVVGLTHVIDDLLETSRLGLGVIELRSGILAVRDLVDDLVLMGRSLAEGRPVEITGAVADSVPPSIVTDANRLRQVLGNLVGNAVKFTDAGHVQLRLHVDGGDLVFEVIDTGRGIPADEIDRVFEPFSTASTGGPAVGAGLGLSIVRQIVEMMGGTTSVASRVGLGSTFVVRLPLERSDTTADDHDGPTAIGATRVLVVEDNHVNQILARSQLERLGLDPVVVSSGEEALALLDSGQGPFVVLMDHQLPGMDGLECTRRIRTMESDGRRRSVIIGVTASAHPSERQASLNSGMDDFLAKPVSLHELGATLGRWTDDEIRAAAAGASSIGTVAPVQPSELDTATLDRLAHDLGGRSSVEQLVATFLDELPSRLSAITTAAQAGDLRALSRGAHTLKSSARLLGGRSLGALCQEAEQATDVNVARSVVTRIASAAETFGLELRGWARGGSGTTADDRAE